MYDTSSITTGILSNISSTMVCIHLVLLESNGKVTPTSFSASLLIYIDYILNNQSPNLNNQVSTDYLCTPAISIFPTFLLTLAFDTTFLNSSSNLSISPDNLRIIVFFITWLQLYFIYTGKLPDVVLSIENGRGSIGYKGIGFGFCNDICYVAGCSLYKRGRGLRVIFINLSTYAGCNLL